MFRPRVGRLKGQSFNRMIPNILTMLALCAGLTAFKFAFESRWEPAVLCILIAAILDSLDGRIARIMKLSSRFGAELDSLSDFFAFGVAPPMMLYLWSLEQAGRIGWVVALIYCVCCALRLARFNTDIDAPSLPPWAKNYFTGVPSPAGAGLVLIPMILSFQIDSGMLRNPILVSAFVIVVGFLMVSRLPTYSFKNVRIQHRYALVMMLAVALIAAFLVIAPWTLLTAILALYIVTLPFALRSFRRLQREAQEFQAQTSLPLDAAPKA
jgi:CDP-diacylglycerol--serine O-phosphatidyltransferase